MKRHRNRSARGAFDWLGLWHENRAFWVLFFIAILVGGGGRGSNISSLIVQLSALTVAWFARESLLESWKALNWTIRILLVVTLLVPVIHLVPLPPAIWQTLPGRDILVQSYEAIGKEGSWAPISLTPGITALALTGLFAPAVLFLLAARLGMNGQRAVLLAIGVCGLVNLAFGSVQLLSENEVGNLYGSRVPDYLYGTFIGHNASGMFFVIATSAMVEWLFTRRPRGATLVLALGAIALFVIATLLTQSRAAVAMLVIPVLLAAYHFLLARNQDRKAGAGMSRFMAIGMVAFALGVGTIIAVQGGGRLSQTIERFEDDRSNRPQLWDDAYVAAERYWPVGSGVGTFDEVFQLDESLETLLPLKAGRAHSEYLEIAVDSGLLGITVLFIWLVYLAVKLVRGPDPIGVSRIFVGGIFLAFAAHSMLDFPLRNQAMLCMAALLLGFLNGPRNQDRKRTDVESNL